MESTRKKENAVHVLVVDDTKTIHATLAKQLERNGHTVEHAFDGIVALRAIEEQEFDLALVDIRMEDIDGLELLSLFKQKRPTMAVVLMTGHATVSNAVEALRNGAADFLTKPVSQQDVDAVVEKAIRLRSLELERSRLGAAIEFVQEASSPRLHRSRIVGASFAMDHVRRQIDLAVEGDCDRILLTGETGTGKEVVAREIHDTGGPRSAPFIAVNCPGLPASLVESELFGHARGAFTGAVEDRPGCFELGHGGTVFLDEISELSLDAQAKALRALETRRVRRLGAKRETPFEARVIAATNVPLERLIAQKLFRQDLYYRLNVISIELPPLRERGDDVLLLARHFLGQIASERGFAIDGWESEVESILRNYGFPGNVRELRNAIERAVIVRREGLLRGADLGLVPGREERASQLPQKVRRSSVERERILRALERARWNRKAAAKLLEMPYSTLRYKMKILGID